jgi:hypothetical protein
MQVAPNRIRRPVRYILVCPIDVLVYLLLDDAVRMFEKFTRNS